MDASLVGLTGTCRTCVLAGIDEVTEWSDECTHVVCASRTVVTHKLVFALLAQKPVVTVRWW